MGPLVNIFGSIRYLIIHFILIINRKVISYMNLINPIRR